MYRSEYEANAQGFRFAAHGSIRNAHRVAYPVACRAGYLVALVLTSAFGIIVRASVH